MRDIDCNSDLVAKQPRSGNHSYMIRYPFTQQGEYKNQHWSKHLEDYSSIKLGIILLEGMGIGHNGTVYKPGCMTSAFSVP
jgi:hypothetical protein